MSSFFALVTPLNAFDGQPSTPGTLPIYPPFPGLPGQGPIIPPYIPGQGPVYGGFPGLPGQGLPGTPIVLPPGGQLPNPGEPGSPGHLPEPPDFTLPTGFVWGYNIRFGWLVVVLPDAPHPGTGVPPATPK